MNCVFGAFAGLGMGAKISSPRRKATTSQICSEILKVYSAIKFLLKAANTPWLAGLFSLSTVWDVVLRPIS